MNARIKSLSWDQLIFFDLEMATGQKTLDPKSELFKIFQWKNRDRDTDKVPTIKETQELYAKKGSLSPITCRIVTGACGYVKNDTIFIKGFKGEEKDVVSGVTKTLNSGRIPGGYNTIFFDHPILRMRHAVLGLGDFPESFNDVGKKEWKMQDNVLDIMHLIKGTYYHNFSLEELCLLFNVKSSKEGGMRGDEVSKAFWEGRVDEILDYNIRDVVVTINLLRVLRGEEQIEKITIID